MVFAPDNNRGGGALDGPEPCSVSTEKSGRFTETSACVGPEGKSVVAARPGGIAVLEDCNLQQGWAAIVAESQSVIIVRQHWWQGAGAKQANAGATAHRATTASIKIAPLLPMDIV